MISGLSIGSLLLILAIVILLFGTKKIRNIGSDLGSAIKNFKKSVKDESDSTASNIEKKESDAIDAEVTKDEIQEEKNS